MVLRREINHNFKGEKEMYEVNMPKIGFSMESGKIVKWYKKEGDKVNKGEKLCDVESDKATIEVESQCSGYLRKIITNEEEEVPVKEIIAYIGEIDEEIPSGVVIGGKPSEKVMEREVQEKKIEGVGYTEEKGKIKISPRARKIAQSKNIDISLIFGSGPGGLIVEKDVFSYIKDEEEKTVKVGEEIKVESSNPLKGIKKVIAERLSYSKKNIPHLVLYSVAEVNSLIEQRELLKDKILAEYGVKITYTDLLLKICALALRENIEINSSFQDNNHIIYSDINIGLAVAVKNGIIVPTIYNTDRLDLYDIAKKRIDLVDKAIKGKLNLEEISNGTFTITNLGMYGIRTFSAIINPPQASILAIGEIYSSPAFINGKIEQKSLMELSLSCDHRIIDGVMGAKFLQRIVELIRNPKSLIDYKRL
jgi:pyruvate dehydrogenase E2 component (dihydrolipoamide acetyltransferase)